jgi:hypothetical protein
MMAGLGGVCPNMGSDLFERLGNPDQIFAYQNFVHLAVFQFDVFLPLFVVYFLFRFCLQKFFQEY